MTLVSHSRNFLFDKFAWKGYRQGRKEGNNCRKNQLVYQVNGLYFLTSKECFTLPRHKCKIYKLFDMCIGMFKTCKKNILVEYFLNHEMKLIWKCVCVL